MVDEREIVQYDVNLMNGSLLWNVQGTELKHYYSTNLSCNVHQSKL